MGKLPCGDGVRLSPALKAVSPNSFHSPLHGGRGKGSRVPRRLAYTPSPCSAGGANIVAPQLEDEIARLTLDCSALSPIKATPPSKPWGVERMASQQTPELRRWLAENDPQRVVEPKAEPSLFASLLARFVGEAPTALRSPVAAAAVRRTVVLHRSYSGRFGIVLRTVCGVPTILKVEPSARVCEGDLQIGDVVKTADGRLVRSLEHLTAIVGAAKSQAVKLTVEAASFTPSACHDMLRQLQKACATLGKDLDATTWSWVTSAGDAERRLAELQGCDIGEDASLMHEWLALLVVRTSETMAQ